MWIRSNLEDLYLEQLPNLREVTYNRYNDWPLQYPKFFDVRSTDLPFENYTGVSGLGLMTQKGETVDIDTDQPIQLYDKKLTPVKYGLAVEHSREIMDDDRHGIVAKQGALLARSARITEEIVAAALADGSHDTYTSADGSYIHAADHPIDGGASTANNLLTSAADLGMAGIQEMISLAEDMVDDRGLPIMAIGKKLVIHREDQFTAAQLLKSPDDPTTADRAVTPLIDYSLTYAIWYYLTDTDAWYLWTDVVEDIPGWIWLDRQNFDLGYDTNERNQTAITVATRRFTLGVAEWRGTFKSLGTG